MSQQIQKLTELILESNILDTIFGERLVQMYDITSIRGFMSVSGRCKSGNGFRVKSGDYITHLVLMESGDVRAVLSKEDTDDVSCVFDSPSKNIQSFDIKTLDELIEVLDY